MTIAWSCVPWAALDRDALYDVLVLRARVFVVEQACVYQDVDGADRDAIHLLGHDSGALVAYARLFAPGKKHEHAAIGRVVVSPESRGGVGRALMIEAIARAHAAFGPGPIHIGAQAYLERFYGSLGFVRSGPSYDEGGILHMPMLLTSA